MDAGPHPGNQQELRDPAVIVGLQGQDVAGNPNLAARQSLIDLFGALHPFVGHPLALRKQPVHIDALAGQFLRVSFHVLGALSIGRDLSSFQQEAESRDLCHLHQLLFAELGKRVVDFDGRLGHEILPLDLPRRRLAPRTAGDSQHHQGEGE